jgi:hypothetical protein
MNLSDLNNNQKKQLRLLLIQIQKWTKVQGGKFAPPWGNCMNANEVYSLEKNINEAVDFELLKPDPKQAINIQLPNELIVIYAFNTVTITLVGEKLISWNPKFWPRLGSNLKEHAPMHLSKLIWHAFTAFIAFCFGKFI